jgi:glycosyltransferase involved in cell wall biosynthesis
MAYPKITIVTPNFNQAGYLEETIQSVLSQNYPNLEYIIVDGGSTDGSLDIIRKYEQQLAWWISEPDKGLYHALQKGFDRSTGEIMGWINSDDELHPGSLSVIAEVFSSLSHVNWITGCPSALDEKGRTVVVANLRKWSKYDYYLFDYQWIQQESTFWRKSLWEKAGARLNLDVKYAADLELWLRLFRYEKLFSLRTTLGGFRFRSSGQLSSVNKEQYLKEAEALITAELPLLQEEVKNRLSKYKRRMKIVGILQKVRVFRLVPLSEPVRNAIGDAPGFIEFDPVHQRFFCPTS